MTTLEERATRLEGQQETANAKFDAFMPQMNANHDAVMREMQVVRLEMRDMQRQMNTNHDALMRTLGEIASGGAIN